MRKYGRSYITFIGLTTLSIAVWPMCKLSLNQFSISLHKTNDFDVIIPPELLKLSDDNKVLYGFKDEATIDDFAYCNTLQIPDSVTEISIGAFAYVFDGLSNKVSKVLLTNSIVKIDDAAFKGCYGIKEINFRDIYGTSDLEYIGNQAFSDCNISGDLYIPNKVTHIGDNAFDNCQYLDGELIIPKSIEYMGRMVFANCGSIHTIDLSQFRTMPKWLYQRKFIFKNDGSSYTSKAKKVLINAGMVSSEVWNDILFNRQALLSLQEVSTGFSTSFVSDVPLDAFSLSDDGKTLNGLREDFDETTLSQYTRLVLPYSVETIKELAFMRLGADVDNCKLDLVLPMNLKIIEEDAFGYCDCLYNAISIPPSVTTIKAEAFRGCNNINSVELPSGLTEMGERIFEGCQSLRSVIFDGAEALLGMQSFANCPSLDLIDFSSYSMTGFPSEWLDDERKHVDAFLGCSSTGRIITVHGFIPTKKQNDKLIELGLTNLGVSQEYDDSCLWDWWEAQEESLPFSDTDFIHSGDVSKLWTLTDEAIANKTNFDTINITNTTEIIEDNAFSNIFSISKVQQENYYWWLNFNQGLTDINNKAFQACTNIRDRLFLPDTIQHIGSMAFANCAHLFGTLILPNGIKDIGDGAFSGCNLLSSDWLNLPNELTSIGSNAFADTKIKQIKVNKNLRKLSGSPFYGMKNLSKIDMLDLQIEDFQEWQASTRALAVLGKGVLKVNGDMYLHHQDMIRNLGLPESWDIVGGA